MKKDHRYDNIIICILIVTASVLSFLLLRDMIRNNHENTILRFKAEELRLKECRTIDDRTLRLICVKGP